MNGLNRALGIGFIKIMLISLCAISLSGCCTFSVDTAYRFDIAYDSAPTAYRNNSNTSEHLNIPIRIRNLTSESICLAGKPDNNGWTTGMILTAKALHSPHFISNATATTIYGFKSGKTIKAIDYSSDYSAFDSHNVAVKKLSSTAPFLLGLDEDDIKSTYKATGNEAYLVLSFPIDWSTIPVTPKVIEKELVLELSLSYQDCSRNIFVFDQAFQHRTKVYFTNGPRGMRSLRTGGDSPKTGNFILTQ